MATSTATATVIATATPMLAMSGMPTSVRPSIEIMTVTPAKMTERPAEWMAMPIESRGVAAVGEVLSVAGDDEQGVVDADRDPDHGRHRGGERDDVHAGGEQPDEQHPDADAEDRTEEGGEHGDDRSERHEQHDDGDDHAR